MKPSSQPSPTLKQLEQKITDGQRPPVGYFSSENRAAAEQIELNARIQFLDLRKRWSGNLKWWIGFLLVFHTLLTIAIGLKLLDFEKYQWFIRILVVEDFLQICGMCFIVVKFLYPTDGRAKKLAELEEKLDKLLTK